MLQAYCDSLTVAEWFYATLHLLSSVTTHSRIFMCVCVQALATLKQKIRKYNKDFESGIEAYRQNPVESGDEEEDEGEDTKDDDDDEGCHPCVPCACV